MIELPIAFLQVVFLCGALFMILDVPRLALFGHL